MRLIQHELRIGTRSRRDDRAQCSARLRQPDRRSVVHDLVEMKRPVPTDTRQMQPYKIEDERRTIGRAVFKRHVRIVHQRIARAARTAAFAFAGR